MGQPLESSACGRTHSPSSSTSKTSHKHHGDALLKGLEPLLDRGERPANSYIGMIDINGSRGLFDECLQTRSHSNARSGGTTNVTSDLVTSDTSNSNSSGRSQ
ncbi:hypothetical protein VTN00DRAFT_7220 [Thermoascus crustaceus]|uniref:uncharacterized protein n=1 Tax=Thermoascus crustaceus TaxID=5088 RepID=UPI003742A133